MVIGGMWVSRHDGNVKDGINGKKKVILEQWIALLDLAVVVVNQLRKSVFWQLI